MSALVDEQPRKDARKEMSSNVRTRWWNSSIDGSEPRLPIAQVDVKCAGHQSLAASLPPPEEPSSTGSVSSMTTAAPGSYPLVCMYRAET